MRRAEPAEIPPAAEAVGRLKSPVLRRMFAAAPDRLISALEPRTYELGEALCRFGAPPDGLWLLVEGEVSVTRRTQELELPRTELRGPGSAFGREGEIGGGDIAVVAESHVLAWFLPEQAFVPVVLGHPGVAMAWSQHTELLANRSEIVRALRMAVCFRNATTRRLITLLERTDRRAFSEGQVALTQGAPATGIFVVLSGELRATRAEGDQQALVDVLTPGEVFGDLAVFAAEGEPLTVTCTRPAVTAFLPASVYHSLVASSPSFRRRVGASAVASVLAVTGREPEAVALVGRQEDARGLAALTTLLAEALAAEQGEHPLLLRLGAPEGPPVERLGVTTMAAPATADGVQAAVERWRSQFQPIFVVASSLADLGAVAPAIGRVVRVGEDLHAPLLRAELNRLPTRHCALTGRGGDPRGYPGRTVRLRMTASQLAALHDPHLADLSPALRSQVGRLARAVTERLVGLALGGGGSWGFAHVALIRALLSGDEPVPIDMVSGASFGALVAAFYCAEGLPGLERLVDQGAWATPATQLSIISSRAFEYWVERHLPGRRLEELDIPMYPVATDVAFGTEYVPRTGPVARGVRASGAMPLLFTPVLVGGSRIVDGGFINNVPASVLRNEGANFVIASNVVATQNNVDPAPPSSQAGRFLRAFHPWYRVQDIIRSSLVLFHHTGLRESMFADATFTSSFTDMQFWNFGRGKKTIEETLAAESFLPSVRRIRERWTAFSR